MQPTLLRCVKEIHFSFKQTGNPAYAVCSVLFKSKKSLHSNSSEYKENEHSVFSIYKKSRLWTLNGWHLWLTQFCVMKELICVQYTPIEWTMHLGGPVVPEEYMINNGWLKGSCSNESSGDSSASCRNSENFTLENKYNKLLVSYCSMLTFY